MVRMWRLGVVVLLLVGFGAPSVWAQTTASVAGVIRDPGGGVIPGVTVLVKEDATGRAYETVTDAEGRYLVPALDAGSYTVTTALAGFKTAETKVRLAPGQPVTLDVTLELGELTETVTVTSSSELVNTATATVASTLNSDQLNRMPTPTRNALNAITFLPGVNTSTTNRNSSINGLPDSFLSITLDGQSNNDNFNRTTDGFFASVYPRQDMVEAVAVTLAAAGAQVGGGAGAVTMAFQTRSGGNRFTGSVYEYWRDPSLNSNYYFNEINDLQKNDVRLNQWGFRAGGPLMIPKVYDGRDKAFFFFHYEQIRFPNSFTRTRTVLNNRALDGWFRYQVGSSVREVNVLQLAAANGQISAKDPTVFKLLQQIEQAMTTTGTRTALADPLLDQYVFLSPGELFEHQPTVRIDYNMGTRHRLSGSFSTITARRDPDYLNSADARFPGAPQYRIFESTRPLFSVSLRSTLGSNIVNELRGGANAFYGFSRFGKPESNGPQNFEDSDGYAIDFDGRNPQLTNWYQQTTPSWRHAPTYSFADTVTWLKGDHSTSFGGSYLLQTAQENAQQQVNQVNLRFDQDFDPARGLFTTANFPSASSTQLNDARDLYALLTGRVGSVVGQAALDPKTNQYVSLGPRVREGKISIYGAFFQDSWRVSPTLTVTGGLRWDVQTPFSAANDVMSAVTLDSICGISGLGNGGLYSKCNFLSPGSSGGVVPQFIQLKRGTEGYKTDWNNLAPSASVAWRPNVRDGFMRTLLGDPEQATIRGGWSVAYDRQGMAIFTGTYGNNPGSTLSLTRDANTGLVPPGESWPVLFSEKNRLYPASFPTTPTYPIAVRENRADDIYAFAPDIQIARAQTWQVGFQRALSRDMAVEIRYVGTRGSNQWSQLNWNQIRGENLVANGFLDEFRLAMTNLAANNASGVSGRVGSFAYFGSGTGTAPLPIYLAYFNGRTDATNPSAYTGGTSTWRSTTFASRLSAANPDPINSAGDLDNNTTRRNRALAAGLPANFFVPNPDVDDVQVRDSGAFSDYHALQIELRRRLSKGLSANVNYQYALEAGSAFDGFSFGRTMVRQGNVRHAFKYQFDWQIPVGRGQRHGADMHPILNGIIGGWSLNGVGRIQARTLDFGDVRLVGMTKSDLQAMYKFYKETDPTTGVVTVWNLPQDVILNTRRAFSTSNTTLDGYSTSLGPPEGRYIAPANTADCLQVRSGDCGVPRSLIIRAPWFNRIDIGATKRFDIQGTMNIEVRIDVLNLFDNVNFNPVADPGDDSDIFQVTSGYTDPSNTYDPGGRLGQIMLRFNW